MIHPRRCHNDIFIPTRLIRLYTLAIFITFTLSNSLKAAKEDSLPDYLQSDLVPLIQRTPVQTMPRGLINVAYRMFKIDKIGASTSNKGLVVFLPGRTEPLIKYIELYDDLLKMGFDVLAIDHRGQGDSDREVYHDGGYVKQFKEYADDAESIIRLYSNQYDRVLGIGQSMGGLVFEHLVFNTREAPLIDKLVLSVPMLKITTAPYPYPLAFTIVKLFTGFGQGKSYTLGQGPWVDEVHLGTSSSVIRRQIAHQWTAEKPRLRVGGATHNWVAEAMWAGKITRMRASKTSTPILLLASDQDEFVQSQEFEPYCQNLVDCDLVVFKNTKHEIFQETDAIRDLALQRISTFFEN